LNSVFFAPKIIHSELTEEDLQKLEMFYQLTGLCIKVRNFG
jgi:hypothetical protein